MAESAKKRKKIAAAILFGGVAVFLIIIGFPGKNQKNPPLAVQNGNDSNSGLDYQTDKNRNDIPGAISGAADALSGTDNLTELLAKSLSQGIFSVNSGVDPNQSTSTIALPSPESLTGAIEQSTNQNFKFPVFSEKDIRIISDNSKEAQIAYIESLGEITENNFNGFSTPMPDILDEYFKKNDSSKLSKYIGIAEKETADLLALKVPQQLSAWHLQNLNLWEKKLVVYKAILNLNEDPLKAILAIKEVNGLMDENGNLFKTINDYVKNAGLRS